MSPGDPCHHNTTGKAERCPPMLMWWHDVAQQPLLQSSRPLPGMAVAEEHHQPWIRLFDFRAEQFVWHSGAGEICPVFGPTAPQDIGSHGPFSLAFVDNRGVLLGSGGPDAPAMWCNQILTWSLHRGLRPQPRRTTIVLATPERRLQMVRERCRRGHATHFLPPGQLRRPDQPRGLQARHPQASGIPDEPLVRVAAHRRDVLWRRLRRQKQQLHRGHDREVEADVA